MSWQPSVGLLRGTEAKADYFHCLQSEEEFLKSSNKKIRKTENKGRSKSNCWFLLASNKLHFLFLFYTQVPPSTVGLHCSQVNTSCPVEATWGPWPQVASPGRSVPKPSHAGRKASEGQEPRGFLMAPLLIQGPFSLPSIHRHLLLSFSLCFAGE